MIQTAGGYRGANAAMEFTSRLLSAFGWSNGFPPDAAMPAALAVVEKAQRTSRTVPLFWKTRRVLVEVVQHDVMLDFAWKDLMRVCLQVEPVPQYVVLTNQRDLHLYDLAQDRAAPRLAISVDDLPKYSEAFPFFESEWTPGTTPRIINVAKVTKEVADLVAMVYRALARKNPKRTDDVIRFTLQCIVAMFAEDIGLLPKAYFTNILYNAGEEGGAQAKLTELFTWMSTPLQQRAKHSAAIPYFNGGLFTGAISLSLDATVLRALTKSSEANWAAVDPHIFGSVFQGVMDDAERHASGAHYTAREDIMSVVGPTIVEPWRERIEAAKTLEALKSILRDLTTYRLLDPACGSGNFLYVAFRELYRLETEVLARIYDEFPSATKGKGKIGWASGIRTTNFFGMDINPFAVQLAKTTLNIAKKIAFEQRKEEVVAKFGQFPIEVDPSLPLDNLDANIVCMDALFTEWPEADAIIGNPPFLGTRKLRGALGKPYLDALKDRFPGINSDFCTYWFRLAHDRLVSGGRAGLIGTSAIRMGAACQDSLQYLASEGGTIVAAVSSKPWPGDSTLNVSVVNWVAGKYDGPRLLWIDGQVHRVREIRPHLQLHAPVSLALDIAANSSGTSLGVTLGDDAFQLSGSVLRRVEEEGAARPMASAGDILRDKSRMNPRYVVWFADCASEKEAKQKSPTGFAQIRREFFPRATAAASDEGAAAIWKQWVGRWWQPWAPRNPFWKCAGAATRIVVCASPQSRPIFVFLSTSFVPTNTLQLFAHDDDYSFGIIQSSLHWEWTKAKGGRLKSDIRYTTSVWKTFPWAQEPALHHVIAVATTARQLRATREHLMKENGWSLRELYRSAEVAGPHPLKDAQAALDVAVEAAYGKPSDQGATEFLLEMNLALAEDEAAGHTVQGPGLPRVKGEPLDSKDPRWFSTDCIEPPAFVGPNSAQAKALAYS